jgi:hypothetical protein
LRGEGRARRRSSPGCLRSRCRQRRCWRSARAGRSQTSATTPTRPATKPAPGTMAQVYSRARAHPGADDMLLHLLALPMRQAAWICLQAKRTTIHAHKCTRTHTHAHANAHMLMHTNTRKHAEAQRVRIKVMTDTDTPACNGAHQTSEVAGTRPATTVA